MAKNPPILNISSERDEDFITIDDVDYPIRNRDTLSFKDIHYFTRNAQKVFKLFSKQEEFSEEENKEFLASYDKLVDFIFIDPPKEVLEKLSYKKREKIIAVFTNLLSADVPKEVLEKVEIEIMKEIGSV